MGVPEEEETRAEVFAVLVGFVNESVTEMMDNLNKGTSKIAAANHTLILGWNESTVRVVCQIARPAPAPQWWSSGYSSTCQSLFSITLCGSLSER